MAILHRLAIGTEIWYNKEDSMIREQEYKKFPCIYAWKGEGICSENQQCFAFVCC